MSGFVRAIGICSKKGGTIELVQEVEAVAGAGLRGNRNFKESTAPPSKIWLRQVTLINNAFFLGTGFTFLDSRRNILTEGIELMDLIGYEFEIGTARMRGIGYCAPCQRPSMISGIPGFEVAFHDRGGLVAGVIQSGSVALNDTIKRSKRSV